MAKAKEKIQSDYMLLNVVVCGSSKTWSKIKRLYSVSMIADIVFA